MGDTNRFAKSIYSFDDPVHHSVQQMMGNFSIILDKYDSVII